MEKSAPQKAEKLVAVKGMNDILPGESARWESLERHYQEHHAPICFREYSYTCG